MSVGHTLYRLQVTIASVYNDGFGFNTERNLMVLYLVRVAIGSVFNEAL